MIQNLPGVRHDIISRSASILVTLVASLLMVVPASAQDLVQEAHEASRIGADDVWIVSLGDSFSSGEGNPENIGTPINAWKWIDDEKCHRSSQAWPYEVAKRLDEWLSQPVRFTFLACSGAELEEGLLRPYTSFDVTKPPQLDRLRGMIERAGRTPDVVLLSGGGNDIGFADIVTECVTPGGCPGGDATKDAADTREDRLAHAENGGYSRVADDLVSMGISPDHVFLLQYPNPLKGQKRNVFGKWSDVKVLAACYLPRGKKAWRWASEHVVEPLQDLQETVAAREGWRLVAGHVDEFQKHSYCPRNAPSDSWWVGMLDQIVRQWGLGTFHPNRRGHDAVADAALSAIQDLALGPDGWEFTHETYEGSGPHVVIAGPASYRGGHPGVVRVRNVRGSGFEMRFQEWDYRADEHGDTNHVHERIPYLVLEPGRHRMPDGSVWEVGTFRLDGTKEWKRQSFDSSFRDRPKLFLTIQTYNGSDAVTARARNVDRSGFEAAFFEETGKNDGHVEELVGYLAIHSPRGSGEALVDGFRVPYALKSVRVDDGGTDVADVRLYVVEETSGGDSETSHVKETVHVLDIGGKVLAQDVSTNGSDPASLRQEGGDPGKGISAAERATVDEGWRTFPVPPM